MRPSITPVKSMPNEDADHEAHTLTHRHTLTEKEIKGGRERETADYRQSFFDP